MSDPITEDLVERVVAFIDLLGFTELVTTACDGDSLALLQVRRALGWMWAQQVTTNEGPFGSRELTPNARATAFSDSIVISDLNRSGEVQGLLRSVSWLAGMLLRLGILCRGGIATGATVHNDHVLFGTGLIRAYNLERNALYPRVVLQDDLVQYVTGPFSPRLKRDSDGLWFIDVFGELRQPKDGWQSVMSGSLAAGLVTIPDATALVGVREFLIRALERHRNDLRTHSKYRWLSNQFNEAVAIDVPGQVVPISF